ncbi:right-handed parallel beta-helix repeat-containing protein [Dyella jejuensis]|uniref:Right-handed parallel beta-helix repeat-containing protein n=1 Tax=Dyella jejuensis TaxID=1432009 RepID=A0ABW8JCG9_9GAMM
MKRAANDDQASDTRRDFLRRSLQLSLPALLLSTLPTPLKAWAGQPQGGASGVVINVRDKGAKGDGTHDDTAAIQSAIDALPAAGGTVTIPPGNYMIDASRAISLRSNMSLQMAPTAQLTAIANNLPRSHVIKVWRVNNVQIVGGRIVGERNGHMGTTGEWGYGLNIEASNNVSVSDLHISDCWGDGIWVGALGPDGNAVPATNVTINRVISTGNRRQGMSIGPVNGVTVMNSTFSNTQGTKPEAGIDIEPQGQGMAQNITISHCTITGNHGTGLETHDNVAGLVIKDCAIHDNAGYGILTVGGKLGVGPSQITIADNVISDNGLIGITIAGNTNRAQITGNTLDGNSNRYFHRVISALSLRSSDAQNRELRIDDSTRGVALSGNKISS